MAEQLFFFSGLIPEKLGVTKRKSIKLSTMLRRLKPHSAGLHRKENTKTTHGDPFIHTLQTHTHTHTDTEHAKTLAANLKLFNHTTHT